MNGARLNPIAATTSACRHLGSRDHRPGAADFARSEARTRSRTRSGALSAWAAAARNRCTGHRSSCRPSQRSSHFISSTDRQPCSALSRRITARSSSDMLTSGPNWVRSTDLDRLRRWALDDRSLRGTTTLATSPRARLFPWQGGALTGQGTEACGGPSLSTDGVIGDQLAEDWLRILAGERSADR